MSHKGYKCLNSNGRIYISRHVVFDENSFPFKEGFLNKPHQTKSNPVTLHHLPFELNPYKLTPNSIDIENPIDESAHESSGGNERVVENDNVLNDEISQQPDLQPESS
ncbi:Retrovirus-related Pol polyprotein from transposon TNT 1-94 [Abeliophyllum distichum]|uniref:Retrovirus-related Pol polyprotein from transposon TNT 1-94 n=1 Tax=Abeliophyllum distichum TaxID=126358 RepID=A0ABD1QUU6_9LAMI